MRTKKTQSSCPGSRNLNRSGKGLNRGYGRYEADNFFAVYGNVSVSQEGLCCMELSYFVIMQVA
jgi:hypothetical protein